MDAAVVLAGSDSVYSQAPPKTRELLRLDFQSNARRTKEEAEYRKKRRAMLHGGLETLDARALAQIHQAHL